MTPVISVIVPVYNVEKYLVRALDSVLNQTFQDFEIICVNDGSTDNSKSILEGYAQKDARIKVFTQTNQGLSMARNSGLKLVQTAYVCFLDSDDTLDKTFLEDLYQEAHKTNADIVMTRTRHIGKRIHEDHQKKSILTTFQEKVSVLSHGGCWNKLYKTDFIKKYQLSFPKDLYWEDNIFTIKACYYSNKMSVIQGGMYNYYQNPTSITQDPLKCEKRQTDSVTMLNLILNFVKEKNCSKLEEGAVLRFCLKSFPTDKNLDCFTEFLNSAKYTIRMKLFGIIPCGKFTQTGNKRKGFLKYLPFIKTKLKLK